MPDVITKAELSRLIDVSRARVSQYCGQGMPVREDGKLDRAAVLEWIDQNINRDDGQTASERADNAETKEHINELIRWGWLKGAQDAVNALRRKGNKEAIALVARALGCSPMQIFGIVQHYDFLLGMWMPERLPEEPIIEMHPEPDWNSVMPKGTEIETKTWNKEVEFLINKAEF